MKESNNKIVVVFLSIAFCVVASVAFAGDVDVIGNSTVMDVLYVKNASTAASDRRAIYAKSTPVPFWGIGGQFYGGYKGVDAYSTEVGTGTRYAGYFKASGGSSSNYGVRAQANGGSTAYGIYSYAYGASTNWAGFFNGNVKITGTLDNPSDEDLKTDIEELDGVLEKLMALKPKAYRYRVKENAELNLPEGEHMGLVAQDLEEVFPELVSESEVPEADDDKNKNNTSDKKRYLSINYIELIPVMIKSIQEQQEQIAELQEQISVCGCR